MNSQWPRRILFGVIVFLLLSLQAARILAIGGVNPDLMLILVLLYSVIYGEVRGEIFGFTLGILQDAMSGGIFGLSAFIYTFLAWFTNFYKRYILVSELTAFVIFVVLATLIKYIFYSFFYLIFKGVGFFSGAFFIRIFEEIAYNAIAGIFFFLLSPFLFTKRSDFF